jgi:hypothetical protein
MLAAGALSCGGETEPPDPAERNRQVEVVVGAHELTLEHPPDWLLLDRETEPRLRKGTAQLAMVDRGAVAGAGHSVRLRRIDALWRRSEFAAALSTLRRVDVRREMFDSDSEHAAFSSRYRSFLAALRDGTDAPEVLQFEYDAVVSRLRAYADHFVEDALPELLGAFGFDDRREIASIEKRVVDGRTLFVVDTWDRRNHLYRKRYALVLNEGSLLVIWSAFGSLDDCEPAIDTLLDSLEFRNASFAPTRS